MNKSDLMRKTLLFLLLLCNTAFAQEFGKNATWYRSQPYGSFKCSYTGDTVILGKTCRAIYQEVLTKPFVPIPLNHAGYLYVYDVPDTVFIYNYLFEKFTPLYIFNVAPGDTITLPALPILGTQTLSMIPDSSFQYVVDSIKDVLYDTTWLQTVYSHSLKYAPRTNPRYVWGDPVNAYARRIGGIDIGLLPHCQSCVELLWEGIYSPGSILCYSDNTTNIKLTGGACNNGAVPLRANELEASIEFDVFPNPATDCIGYRNKTGKKIRSVKVFDVSGKEMWTPNLSVNALANGLYFVSFQFEDMVLTRKITVQH